MDERGRGKAGRKKRVDRRRVKKTPKIKGKSIFEADALNGRVRERRLASFVVALLAFTLLFLARSLFTVRSGKSAYFIKKINFFVYA